MPRNLDLTALRSFVAVADSGGVTRAAGLLNLTQSAVSMQLKRLEEGLNVPLLDRTGRTIALTAQGAQLLGYARRMLNLNDEVYGRLTAPEFKGELRLGVPHDIIYPAIPPVLKQFAVDFPQMQVRLISAPTRQLKEMFSRGECDFILTTEESCDSNGETLVELPLVWIGAVDGVSWRTRPLRMAFCSNCIFRPVVIRMLDAAEMPWDMVVETEFDNAVEAAVSADLAVSAVIRGDLPPNTAPITHGGALPDLGWQKINLYVQRPEAQVDAAMAELIRQSYRAMRPNISSAA